MPDPYGAASHWSFGLIIQTKSSKPPQKRMLILRRNRLRESVLLENLNFDIPIRETPESDLSSIIASAIKSNGLFFKCVLCHG